MSSKCGDKNGSSTLSAYSAVFMFHEENSNRFSRNVATYGNLSNVSPKYINGTGHQRENRVAQKDPRSMLIYYRWKDGDALCYPPPMSTRRPKMVAAVASTPLERRYRMPHCPRSRAASTIHLLLAVWPRMISQHCRLRSHRTR